MVLLDSRLRDLEGSQDQAHELIEALSARLAALELREAALTEELRQLTAAVAAARQAPVTVHVSNHLSGGLAASSSSGPPEPEPQTTPPPVSPPVRPRPNFAVRKFYVIRSGGSVTAPNGVYITYSAFAEAARDPAVAWSGRGKLRFRPDVETLSFSSASEAEAWWREVFHEGPVPYYY